MPCCRISIGKYSNQSTHSCIALWKTGISASRIWKWRVINLWTCFLCTGHILFPKTHIQTFSKQKTWIFFLIFMSEIFNFLKLFTCRTGLAYILIFKLLCTFRAVHLHNGTTLTNPLPNVLHSIKVNVGLIWRCLRLRRGRGTNTVQVPHWG